MCRQAVFIVEALNAIYKRQGFGWLVGDYYAERQNLGRFLHISLTGTLQRPEKNF